MIGETIAHSTAIHPLRGNVEASRRLIDRIISNIAGIIAGIDFAGLSGVEGDLAWRVQMKYGLLFSGIIPFLALGNR